MIAAARNERIRILYITVLLGWCLLAYSAFVNLLMDGKMFARTIKGQVLITDFVNHYNAGLLSRQCLQQRIAIYDPAVQAASEEKVIAPVKPELPFYLQYPPYFFALAMPLSFFSLTGAYVVWTAAGSVALGCTLAYILNSTACDRRARLLAIVAVLASYPAWLSFGMGQTALFNFAAIVATFALLRKERPLSAGLAASLVAVKLQYAPAMIVIGLICGRLRFAAGVAIGLAALIAYAALIVGVDNVLAFPHALMTAETSEKISGVSPDTMQNLRGYMMLLTHNHGLVVPLAVAGFIAGIGAIAALWWRAWRPPLVPADAPRQRDDRFRWLVIVTLPIVLLTSLHSHVYDYIMMSASCIWVWDATVSMKQRPDVKLLRALILLFPLFSWGAAAGRQLLNAVFIQPVTIWCVAYLVICLRLLPQFTTGAAEVADR